MRPHTEAHRGTQRHTEAAHIVRGRHHHVEDAVVPPEAARIALEVHRSAAMAALALILAATGCAERRCGTVHAHTHTVRETARLRERARESAAPGSAAATPLMRLAQLRRAPSVQPSACAAVTRQGPHGSRTSTPDASCAGAAASRCSTRSWQLAARAQSAAAASLCGCLPLSRSVAARWGGSGAAATLILLTIEEAVVRRCAAHGYSTIPLCPVRLALVLSLCLSVSVCAPLCLCLSVFQSLCLCLALSLSLSRSVTTKCCTTWRRGAASSAGSSSVLQLPRLLRIKTAVRLASESSARVRKKCRR